MSSRLLTACCNAFPPAGSVVAVIDGFLTRDESVLHSEALRLAAQEEAHSSEESDVVREIKSLLEKHAKPFVQADGGSILQFVSIFASISLPTSSYLMFASILGDIEFVGYQGGVVQLRMVGACASCPSSTVRVSPRLASMDSPPCLSPSLHVCLPSGNGEVHDS